MNPHDTPCGRCGHTLHGGAQPDSRACAFPGCDCSEWERPRRRDPAPPTRAASGSARSTAPHLTYSIDVAASLVRLGYQGAPSFEQWQQTMEAALADPAFQPGFSFLVDRRFDEPPTPEYVRRVIAFLWHHLTELAGGCRAIVTWTPASYGMARVERALATDLPLPIEVFMDIDEAERWLRGRGAA